MKKILLLNSIFVLSLFVRAIQAQTIDTLSSTLPYSYQHSSKWNFIPIIYSQPEIGIGFGARAVKVYRDNKSTPQSRPSTIPLTIIYTTKKQTIANIRSDLWFENHLYHFSSLLGYQNYPFKFYGIGYSTRIFL